MEVSLGILGEVKVYDYVDSLDIDAPGEEICQKKWDLNLCWYLRLWKKTKKTIVHNKLTSADQVSAQSISEVVKHTVSVFLKTNRRKNAAVAIWNNTNFKKKT